MNHNQLYFIVIDSNDNVFGHYHSSVINKTGFFDLNIDSNIFIFTLNNNGRCGIKKFNNKNGKTGTWIWNSDNYYNCYCGYDIYQIDTNNSYIDSSIENCFSGIEKTILTGNTNDFTTKRIIVIQMK